MPSQTQLWDSLQRDSLRTRPEPKLLTSFENGILDVGLLASDEETTTSNRYDLLCPRSGCASTIIKAGVGKLVERESIIIEPSNLALNPLLPNLPVPPELMNWWLVTPSPMQFENIGFSRPVESVPLSPSGKGPSSHILFSN
ncbi:hypothetical protein Moror_15185 [Moniliophthora roreri MCA 2997]|uniref:Uncharacterized protein n=2 Tax=Moniliophthora roreri TaxID=221103 RepID=V2X1T7_MONRO|nr:hypothetical protein Moror_15185 [Moniliophthora roreri MCA 2997]KAI3595162.1 hypothetical protein WG66_009366 [Moniliophthora roreri]